MSRRMLKACGTFMLMLALATGVAADDDGHRGPVTELQMGTDRIVGGGSFSVTEPVIGDLIVAGGNVDIDAAVEGDLLAAGGNLRISEDVAQSVYAAGGHVKVAAKIGRNLRLAGGQIDIGPKAQIGWQRQRGRGRGGAARNRQRLLVGRRWPGPHRRPGRWRCCRDFGQGLARPERPHRRQAEVPQRGGTAARSGRPGRRRHRAANRARR